ncbi:hypothetical protein [Solidesulfovibrio sp.]
MISITCPNGFGETDRSRCFDRARRLLPPMVCLLCPIPIILVAEGGRDNVNRQVFCRLDSLISSPWTPPPAVVRQIRASRAPRTITRGLALSRAVARYLAKAAGADLISLQKLLPIYNAVPMAVDLADVGELARVIRRQGLPLQFRQGRPFLVVSDHLRAFVRAHKEAA